MAVRPSIAWLVVMGLAIVVMPVFADVNSRSIPAVVFIATCISLHSALGFWLGFGASIMRFPAIVVSSLVVTAVMHASIGGPSGWEPFFLVLFLSAIVMGIVSIPIIVIRRIRRGKLNLVRNETDPTVDALQFGIGHILIFMAAVAILTTLIKTIWPVVQSHGGDVWILITKLGWTLGICSIVVIWSALGRDAFMRTLVSAVVAAGIASLNFWIIRSTDGWLWLGVTALVWTEITILMWLIRTEGYRFVSEKRPD